MAAKTPDYKNIASTNAIINGGFEYWQRGGISSAVNTTTSFAYAAADRWLHRHTGTFTGTPNVQRDADSPSNNFSTYALRHRFRRNASTALLEHQQRIESIFSKQLLAKGPVSVSFWVKSTLNTGFVRFRLRFATASDNHASQTEFYDSGNIAVSTSGVWQEVKVEAISLPSGAVNGIALVIQYDLPSGTDASDQDFEIAQVSMVSGVQAKDFEPAGGNLAEELRLCQRYYEKSYSLNSPPGSAVTEGALYNTADAGVNYLAIGNVRFSVVKRITPTVTLWNPITGLTSNPIRNINTSTNGPGLAVQLNELGFFIYLDFFAVSVANSCATHYTANAEIN